jgi:hypothetical protein
MEFPEDDLIQLNYPSSQKPNKKPRNELRIHAGYVKPGKHTIIVFVPDTQEFYRKDVIIKARKNELHVNEWPVKPSKMNLDMEEPERKFRIKPQSEEQEDIDVIDFEEFVFKDWFFENSQNIDKIFSSDFVGRDLNITVLSNIDNRVVGKSL